MATLTKPKNYLQSSNPAPVAPSTAQMPRPSALPAGYTPPSSIAAPNVGVQPLKTPAPQVPTAAAGLSETLNALRQQLQARNQADAEAANTAKNESKGKVDSLVERLRGMNTLRTDLYEEQGVNQLRQETDDLLSQMEAKDLAAIRKIEKIEANAGGLETGAVQAEILRTERENAREQADLGIVLSAKTRSLDTAASIIDDAVNAETEDLKFELDSAKFFYEENRADFNKAEDRFYGNLVKEIDREYNQMRDDRKEIRNMQLTAAQNGAPASIVSAVGKANTFEEAMQAIGNYASDPLERQYKIAQINKIGYENALIKAAQQDRANGVLNEDDIKAIDASPQGKQLQVASTFKLKLSSYQDLVKKHGFEMKGADKAVLENAYTELQLAYKEIANLGVLAGPDLGLIETAIRSATPGFFGQVGNIVTLGGGTRKLEANLEQAQTTLNNSTSLIAEQLYARNSYYKDSLYVQSLILPFGDELITSDELAQMEALLNQ